MIWLLRRVHSPIELLDICLHWVLYCGYLSIGWKCTCTQLRLRDRWTYANPMWISSMISKFIPPTMNLQIDLTCKIYITYWTSYKIMIIVKMLMMLRVFNIKPVGIFEKNWTLIIGKGFGPNFRSRNVFHYFGLSQ